jgi:3D (Asp-Asp-Asp) domain-containing protein
LRALVAGVAAATLAASPAQAARTSYATCYQLQGITSSGTYVNKRTAAHNFLPPGAKIRLVGRQAGPRGVRKYIVRDTGPALSDGHFDLWAPSGCIRFGKRTIRWKLGWRRP